MYDIAIIGGGINGAGLARDAAGQGLGVLLLEKDDLASHTSSASTKLIHGGLRYLEQREFALVRKALQERERLLAIAPHLVRPMRFVLPLETSLRPAWLLRLGLFLYDHLAHRAILPGTQSHVLQDDPYGAPLQNRLKKAFSYSDCWVDDARLVVLNARDAAAHGADIRTHTACTALTRLADRWVVRAGEEVFEARTLVNAAGPWVDSVAALHGDHHSRLRLVKGSHIILPSLYQGDHAYIFQNGDGRIVFAIPYEGRFTLIGTTDVAYALSDGAPFASCAEQDYLCVAASEYFCKPITPDDIVWTYSGVRPLFDDKSDNASHITRDYVFDFDNRHGAPILSIFGGKITTYRILAVEAMRRLAPELGHVPRDWTGKVPLPGGDFAVGKFGRLVDEALQYWPFMERTTLERMMHAYGTDLFAMLGKAQSLPDLGQDFGHGLYEVELRHLVAKEWAQSGDDILWRRTKLGLHMNKEQRNRVEQWMQQVTLHD